MPDAALPSDPLWYKDAIIYQLHVKAFFDASDDGIGDFQGLTRKLDYLKDLGVTALWLLPFYPSPLRDDGYDIADYRSINPAYGTAADFRAFVRAAHQRGLRVITELVINHTSDQHPWFQRARHAKRDSVWRNFYVWSDTDKSFAGTRIIFLDTEKSNWAWDPVAQQYYWHRFYSHQPDLNFDNPRVVREVLSVMRYWLDIGVDGMRLDAVPYLIEREGTSSENLPETHAILRQLRAALDRRYGDRMLLAEANQWPEDVLQYFGDGDECHMAFHFPLMPRIFMAVATEDRHPITDIMRQTPDIPQNCQWAVFLRNHDELTLEMVTDRERDYLWNYYATDKRMRLNLGIRRRLAPLMENDRRRLELLSGLMFSMPGTPVMYYGDEIGMGDNIFLGDRDGVRTPMQWSPDRNAGFSRADPAQLYLPPIMDPVYGYQAVNVEAQSRSPSSQLNWMKRLIAVRKARRAFGRGDLRFLYPSNRKVLAFLRSVADETILCVFNLSRAPQAVELDLSGFVDHVPLELGGRSAFPRIGELPYLLSLPGHGFYWFLLDPAAATEAGLRVPLALPEFITLVLPGGWSSLLGRHNRRLLEQEVLPAFLPTQRWFGAKDRRIERVTLVTEAEIGNAFFAVIEVAFATAAMRLYSLPLAVRWEASDTDVLTPLQPSMLAHARRARAEGAIYDATAEPRFALTLATAMRDEQTIAAGDDGGKLVFHRTSAFDRRTLPEQPNVKRIGAEQSNSSLLIEDYAVLKIYRRLIGGVHPEVEMALFLTEVAHFANTPPLMGHFALERASDTMALGVMFANLRNQGDAWSQALNYLTRYLDEALLMAPHEGRPAEASAPADQSSHPLYLELVAQLGQRTAELHRALCPADAVDTDFVPEPIAPQDLARWKCQARSAADAIFASLGKQGSALPPPAREAAERLLARRDDVLQRFEQLLPDKVEAMKTRLHGDYHLGQVLVIQNDYAIIDFEGEPLRPLAERRCKASPLYDVAGMLRSFAYAAASGVRQMTEIQPAAAGVLHERGEEWRRQVTAAFLERYRDVIAGTPSYPEDPEAAESLLAFFTLEKALYEIGYELANRPAWAGIPIAAALATVEQPERAYATASAAARAVVEGRHGDPFAYLGMHQLGARICVRALLPHARRVFVVQRDSGRTVGELPRIDEAGLFSGAIADPPRFRYRLRAETGDGTVEFDDIYAFPPLLGDLDIHLLSEGRHQDSHAVLGAHCRRVDDVDGVGFAVWAPTALRVSLVGAFNEWDGKRCPMRLRHGAGVWEIFVPGLASGQLYKYEIVGPDGTLQPLKADPHADWSERPSSTASRVAPPPQHDWRDAAWLAERRQRNDRAAPIAIYEAHLGSWRRKPEAGDAFLSYRELADTLVPYVRDMGFTHLEFMPVTEHPFDGSWGYQPIGLYAPTSRFGTPDDFRALADACHAAGIALWLDWVPGHFPNDPHGLARFDGTALYEHEDPPQGFQRDWNTLVYNYGRREVANFLTSSALAWIRDFHVDGLRVDAVASMLYLDYSRAPGEWIPNRFGGRENLEAIDFLRRTNELVFGLDAGATTAAEESTAWPMVSRPTYVGGLGFGYKWNMGWMHDTLRYMSQDPIHRRYHHNDLTFGLLYAFQENFILPLSHDEVVHGKGALLAKMPGDRWQRFANLRAYFGFMWTHPGKKLLFMGGEFAQEREWNHDRSLDWHLLDDPLHRGVQSAVRDLNRLYRDLPALHALDTEPEGFRWIDAGDAEQSVLSFLRLGRDPRELAVAACNFTPVPRHDYRIGVPLPGRYRECFNSDARDYGGSGLGNSGEVRAEPHPAHGHAYSLRLLLPPLATLIFTHELPP